MRHQNRKTLSLIIIALLILLFSLDFVVNAQEGTLKWTYSGCGGSPAIGPDGTIYCVGDGLVAVNPDGTQKWVFSEVEGPPVIGPDGAIYCVGDGLVAVNPDGSQKWIFPDIHHAPAIGADGTIYAAGNDTFYAVNPDGTQKWSVVVETFPDPQCYPECHLSGLGETIIGSDGTFYVLGSIDDDFWYWSAIFAIDSEGTQIWMSKYGASLSMAIGADGTIYGTTGGARATTGFHAINPDGTIKWGERGDCGNKHFGGLAIGIDGTIYMGREIWDEYEYGVYIGEKLFAYNPDGTEKWTFPDAGGAPVIGADGTIYAAGNGNFYAINPDGTEKWVYENADINGVWDCLYRGPSPTISADGTLYVTSRDEDGNYINLYAINTSSLGLTNSSWPMFRHDARHTGRSDMQIINDFVSFDPIPSTYSSADDGTGCPIGFTGKFSFDAMQTNTSLKQLTDLAIECSELTNNNLLLTDSGLLGEGARFPVSRTDDYADGILSPGEYVDVPFTVCLQDKSPFRFFVNVLGDVAD
jgi:PQQ-like domain